MKTAQPDRFGPDRRKKDRIEQIKFIHCERLEYNRWYKMLFEFLQIKLRKKKGRSFFLKLDNNQFLPKEVVRQELKHVFQDGWKCAVFFDDDTSTFFMHDLR